MTQSADRLSLLTGIEACRPGSEDIASSELSHVAEAMAADDDLAQCYAAVQQSDAAMAEAFRDVPPPAGLQERLLAALDAAELDAIPNTTAPNTTAPNTTAPNTTAPNTAETDAPEVSKKPYHTSPTRRWLITGGIAAGLLIATGIGIGIWNQPTPASGQKIANVATDLHIALTPEAFQSDTNPPRNRPAFGGLRRPLTLLGWAEVRGLGDNRAIAYAYCTPRGATATLYVFNPRAINPTLPANPGSPVRSSGVTVGVWQSGGLAYALVVDGGMRQYWEFVPKPDLA